MNPTQTQKVHEKKSMHTGKQEGKPGRIHSRLLQEGKWKDVSLLWEKQVDSSQQEGMTSSTVCFFNLQARKKAEDAPGTGMRFVRSTQLHASLIMYTQQKKSQGTNGHQPSYISVQFLHRAT